MKSLFDSMAESGRSVLDNDSVYAEYNKLSPEAKKIADLMAEKGRAALDDDSVYAQYNKLSAPVIASKPAQSQASKPEEKSVGRKLQEMFLPYSTRNEDKSIIGSPAPILSAARDVLTLPLRAVAGVGAAAGEALAHPMSPSTGTSEAFRSGMTDPERESSTQLDQAGVTSPVGRIAAGIGSGMATDPTTIPSMFIGGPVGKTVIGRIGKAAVVPAATAALSNITRQLTEKPVSDFSGRELLLTTGLASGLGAGLSGLARGIGGLAAKGLQNKAKISMLENQLADDSHHIKRADKYTAQLDAINNPKVSPSIARDNPVVFDEALDEVANNPKFAKLTEQEQMETARGMSYRMDPSKTKVGAENARLDKIDALKQQMASELNGTNPNIKLKAQDITEPELANWIKTKQVELDPKIREAMSQDSRLENLLEARKAKLVSKSKFSPDFSDIITSAGYGTLGGLAGGPKAALLGAVFGLTKKPLADFAKTVPYRFPGELASATLTTNAAGKVTPQASSAGVSYLKSALEDKKKKK